MKIMPVLKMLLEADDWEYITPFKSCPSLIEVTHKSGIFYFKGCKAVKIHKGFDELVFDSGPFWHIFTGIAATRLEKILNNRGLKNERH